MLRKISYTDKDYRCYTVYLTSASSLPALKELEPCALKHLKHFRFRVMNDKIPWYEQVLLAPPRTIIDQIWTGFIISGIYFQPLMWILTECGIDYLPEAHEERCEPKWGMLKPTYIQTHHT